MITYKILPRAKLVFLKSSGLSSLQESLEHLKKLRNDPMYSPDFDILCDYRELKSTLTYEETTKLVSHIQKRESPVNVAIVASSDLIFGVARMFEMLSNGHGIYHTMVYRTMEEALQWLKRVPEDLEP